MSAAEVKALVDATILFEREPCACCDCCEGYCPDSEGSRWEAFITVQIGDQEYVGTRHAIIRRDRLTGLPDDLSAMEVPATGAVVRFQIPDEPPPLFAGRHVAVLYDSLDRAGLVCRRPLDADDQVIHLYSDGEHVGWTSRARDGKGITLDELGPIRRIAKAAWIPLSRAEIAYREALSEGVTA